MTYVVCLEPRLPDVPLVTAYAKSDGSAGGTATKTGQ